jgi:ABC-type lipoprotein export system ATPase subunit
MNHVTTHPHHQEKPVTIEASGVNQSFSFGDSKVDILKDINFSLRKNSFNIIYGPSGSGKSTLLNILTGLQKPTTGKVVFDGKMLYELTPDELASFRANEIGIVYQQNSWVRSLNVLENVSMSLYFSGHSRISATELAMEALAKVGMTEYSRKNPTLLSGGEQQRIAIARAIVNDPSFIIADEPTGSLDSTNGDKVMSLLGKFHSLLGRTIILVSHNMEYIPLADSLLRIEDGNIVEVTRDADITTTADKLLRDMKHRIDALSRAKHHA